MSTSGDAAEQVVRISLDGVGMLLRFAGEDARSLTKMLIRELKKPHRTKGKASLWQMMKQKKPISVFEIRASDLRRFCEAAKKYGVMYHVLKEKNSDKCDILVRAEDASKVNRIFERFEIGANNTAHILSELERTLKHQKQEPERTEPEKSPEARFVEELLRTPQKEKAQSNNPSLAGVERSQPSAPTSQTREDHSNVWDQMKAKPSVKKAKELLSLRQKDQTTMPRIPKEHTKGR